MERSLHKWEAIKLMQEGKKLTHDYFEPGEYVTMTNNVVYDSNGYQMPYFLSDRSHDGWQTGWRIFDDKGLGFLVMAQ